MFNTSETYTLTHDTLFNQYDIDGIRELFAETGQHKVLTIKWVTKAYNLSLRDAKQVVEDICIFS